MYARDEPCAPAVFLVIFQEELSGLFIQRALGVRVDEQALDRHKDMCNSKGRLPVFLEGVYTDLTGRRYVWVKDFRHHAACEVTRGQYFHPDVEAEKARTFWWCSRELLGKVKLDLEEAARVGCALCSGAGISPSESWNKQNKE